ncbi:hypothetical protein GZ212_00305 [Mangrovimonas sp. CR14]|uniref:MliC family protein n=1 Tax=Mangrovimonas sp. CR14 TaxID=2706120 RepID=UPI00141F2494|nr:MliC family protein [Mangrovimonas sp. CR14]NIK90576.1 hypothetical protein [Mangrovimonas sp. CR14]
MKYNLLALMCFAIISCKNESKTTSQFPVVAAFDSITEIYKAEHDDFSFKIMRKSDDSLFMLDLNNEKVYNLTRKSSGSGEKYMTADGKILWLKGENFMWGTDNQTEYQGTIRSAESNTMSSSESHGIYGTYIDNSYEKRNEGYDWVSVTVTPFNEHQALISVRSRIDQKKPTCSFDALANIQDTNTMSCNINGAYIIFSFNDDKISINGNNEEDNNKLYFFCSGGGTIKGTYKKLDTPIDKTQVDNTDYIKFHSYPNGLAVRITAKDKNLQISPIGLTLKDQDANIPYQGDVYNSEMDDLDANGSPEIYIYVQELKNGIPFRKVIAYSFNGTSSMTPIYMAPIEDNPELSIGYEGYDEFAVVEGSLIRRFPNAEGGIKQIQYKLTPGEAMWQLTPDKVTTY